ncbi:hypothetical protein ACJX0J_015849 [Zea mays]
MNPNGHTKDFCAVGQIYRPVSKFIGFLHPEVMEMKRRPLESVMASIAIEKIHPLYGEGIVLNAHLVSVISLKAIEEVAIGDVMAAVVGGVDIDEDDGMFGHKVLDDTGEGMAVRLGGGVGGAIALMIPYRFRLSLQIWIHYS